MTQFLCRIGTPEGAVLEQVHQGRDSESLRTELQRKGYHVFDVRRRGIAVELPIGRGRRRKAIPYQRFLVFNQELAALLAAGLPLLHAIDLMLERMKDTVFRSVLQEIREQVESGQELSAAFEAHRDLFPRLYPSTLKAGERSGDLEKVIRRFVRYLQLVLEARKRVVSALVYPAVLVVLSAAMVVVMTVFVVPKFAVFYADLDAQLPLLTRITLGIGSFLREQWLLIAAALVGGWISAARLGAHRPPAGSPSTACGSSCRFSARCSTTSPSPSSPVPSPRCSRADCRWCRRSRSRSARWATPSCARGWRPASRWCGKASRSTWRWSRAG